MPTVIEQAKEAGYTALGLNVLFIDEVNERFSAPIEQMEEQFDIARDHAKKAQAEWQKQADEFTENFRERLPFDLDEVTEQVQDRVQPIVRRSWEAAEPVVDRLTELTPAPFGDYMKDGVERFKGLVVDEPAKKAAPRKAAAKTTKKTTAKKAAPKASAKKAPAKKAPAKKG